MAAVLDFAMPSLKMPFYLVSHQCTEVQNDRFSSGEFYKLDLNGNELLKLISPFSSPNEPNFLQ